MSFNVVIISRVSFLALLVSESCGFPAKGNASFLCCSCGQKYASLFVNVSLGF